LNCFSQESLEETAFLAASMAKVNAFKFLCERGISPFRLMTSMQYNVLHIACLYGYTDIVQVILTTNPHEEQLNILSAYGDTADALAVNTDNDTCKDLLQKN
jgi:ankyrin repeat protein